MASRNARRSHPGAALVSGRQAEIEYGPPYRSLYDLYLRGVLPAVRFPGGRRLWFRRADIERLIDSSVETIR